MRKLTFTFCLAVACFGAESDLEKARDRQDRAALEKVAANAEDAAKKSPKDAATQYQAALAWSYVAEVAVEMRDKPGAQRAAESGTQAADRAIALQNKNGEYYRVLATLCGQEIYGGNILSGIGFAKRAKEAVAKAKELDPKSPRVYVAEGVGNYYLPTQFGGGPEVAVRDFNKAIELDSKNSEAYLWLGVALRKAHRNAEARTAFAKAIELNPNRIWAKQQLEKTPAQ
jgi:tetratricopeptide (TPR) repeat protein